MTTSIRKARYDARETIGKSLASIFEPTRQVTFEIQTLLNGRSGMTPDEQAEALNAAAGKVGELAGALEQIDVANVIANLAAVQAQLTEAAQFATTRDFDAHQQAKAEAGEGALPALDGEGFVVPGEQIGYLLVAGLADDLAGE